MPAVGKIVLLLMFRAALFFCPMTLRCDDPDGLLGSFTRRACLSPFPEEPCLQHVVAPLTHRDTIRACLPSLYTWTNQNAETRGNKKTPTEATQLRCPRKTALLAVPCSASELVSMTADRLRIPHCKPMMRVCLDVDVRESRSLPSSRKDRSGFWCLPPSRVRTR
jgi:hypothetical protein